MRCDLLRSLVLACTLAWACGGPTAPSGPVDQQITLALGQMMRVSAASVTIRFETVLEDSRCPGDAICIWAGDAVIRLDIDGAGRHATHDLHTAGGRAVLHRDLTITLLDLAPHPFRSRPTLPADYRATIRIVR